MTNEAFMGLLAAVGCPSDSLGRGKCPSCGGGCFLVAGGLGTCSTCRKRDVVAALQKRADKVGIDTANVELHIYEPARFLDVLRGRVAAEAKLPWKTASEILATTPVRVGWVAWPLAASGMLTELTGKAKIAGKTTLLMHLIGAVVEGRPFLGEATVQGPVVLLTEERAVTLCLAMHRAKVPGDDVFVISRADCAAMAWPEVVADAMTVCKAAGAVLLIVDTISPFAGLYGDRENNAGDALEAIAPLQAAAALGIAVLVVRHERKGGGELGEAGRGSTAFTGAVDITASLQRLQGANERRRGLRLSGRAALPEMLAIELTDEGYVRHGEGRFSATDQAESAILGVLRANLTMTEADFARLLPEIPRSTRREALENLHKKGTLVRTGTGKRSDAFRFALVGDETGIPMGTVPSETNHAGDRRLLADDGVIVPP